MQTSLPKSHWSLVCGRSTAIAQAVARGLCLERASVVPLAAGFSAELKRACPSDPPLLALLIDPEADMVASITRSVKRRWPDVRVLIAGVPHHESVLIRCFAAGADGLVLAHEPLQQLTEAIQSVLAGGFRVPPETRPFLNRLVAVGRGSDPKSHLRLAALSRRQTEVLSHLGRGITNKEIASELHLEVRTVKNHVNQILRKLGVRNRSDAVRVGIDGCANERPEQHHVSNREMGRASSAGGG
jgi:DNA-binding NarL/FixJ family response regulator